MTDPTTPASASPSEAALKNFRRLVQEAEGLSEAWREQVLKLTETGIPPEVSPLRSLADLEGR